MNSENQNISDRINNFFIENGINQSETPTPSPSKENKDTTKFEISSEPPTKDIEANERNDYKNNQDTQFSFA